MNKIIKNIIWGSVLTLLPFSNLFANDETSGIGFFNESSVTTSDNPGGHDPGDDPVDAAPIDSYAIFLLLLAILVAYYRRDNLVRKR